MGPQQTNAVLVAVERFNDALDRRDFEQLATAMTEDCVFEDTDPRPNGRCYRGKDAVLSFFKEMAESSPASTFEVEEMFTSADRCVMLWNHHWTRGGVKGNNRGVDVFLVREGKVAEKLSYTKNG